jgi:hypothetical protein
MLTIITMANGVVVVYTETHWQIINSYNCCQAVTRETFAVTPVVTIGSY